MGYAGGEPYRLEFTSADAQTPASTKLFDADGNERTLESWEYIRLENLNVQMDNAVDEVEIFDDVDDDDTVDEGERIVTVGTNTTGNSPANHDIQFDGDGKRLSKGRLPKVHAAAAGSIVVTGVAHVHVAGDYGQTPPWKAQFGQ